MVKSSLLRSDGLRCELSVHLCKPTSGSAGQNGGILIVTEETTSGVVTTGGVGEGGLGAGEACQDIVRVTNVVLL